jgi:cytochrome b involved in lipid metabolism
MATIKSAYFLGTLFVLGAIMAGCAATPVVSQGSVPESRQSESSPSTSDAEPDSPEAIEQPTDENEAEPDPESPAVEEPQTTEGAGGDSTNDQPIEEEVISWSLVEEHSTFESCWIVLKGSVFDFSQVVQQHPFGAQISSVVCGKDATETFQENADVDEVISRLEPFYIGPIG